MRNVNETPKSEIAFGYKLKGHDYLVFDKKEIASARPVSSKLIELDKFIKFFEVDPALLREDVPHKIYTFSEAYSYPG